MNCQTFEPAVNDLARGQMMEASLRDSALAHAEDCERCAARLADERMLSSGLRAFAASVETLEAPAHLETTLRAAFRQRNTIKPAPVVSVAPTHARRWTVWATAAAAAVVTVIAIQSFRLRETPAPLDRAGNTANISSLKEIALAPIIAYPPDALLSIDEQGETVAISPTPTPVRQTFAANYKTVSNKPSRRPRETETNQADSEITTDFMPLTYGAALNPNEGGQLVRVELPRSALVSLGLPMNAERSDERVKADVLLGHDGLARAIRFVR